MVVSLVSSSDDEDDRRRRRRDKGGETKIRATSRPGKKNEYAFVRSASKGRRKSEARRPTVTDLELKTDRKSREFRKRRDTLEDAEGVMLIRAKSQERDYLVDGGSERDIYQGPRRRSGYITVPRGKRENVDDGRREIVIERNDRDRDRDRDREDRRRSTRYPPKSNNDRALVLLADERDLRSPKKAPRRRRVSLSPDRDSVASSRIDDGSSVRRANTVTSRNQRPRRQVYDDRMNDSEAWRDPQRDSAYYSGADGREREALEREKRAIEREKAALDREKVVIDREKRASLRDAPDSPRRGPGDYLKQGDQYMKDGQKYYKSGQGLLSGMKNLLT
jgi:hypothetical protein